MSPATVVLLVAGLLAGAALAGRARRLAPAAPPPGTRVSVVVPARDEARRLPRLLDALAAADPAPFEVVVADDGSTDATAALARVAGARVVRSEPPAGWTGKAHACQRGADAARGDVLVFLDADTEPAPSLVGSLAAAAVADGGALVSAHPRHRVEQLYEHASVGTAVVALLGAGTGGPPARRWWRRPVAFGPAVGVRRADYEAIGGHRAVRAAVADDLALAAAADRAGVAVHALLGGPLLDYRMYPEGLGRLVEGWTKNLSAGAMATPPARLAATVVWVTAALQSGGSLLLAAATGTGHDLALAAAWYGAFAVQFGVVLRRIGHFGPVTAALHGPALLAFLALFARSVLLDLRRRPVPWRGRHVPARP